MQVKKRDGSTEAADRRKISRSVERAFRGLDDVDAKMVTDEAYRQLYDGIQTADIDRATVLAARARIALEPNYSYGAARLLLNSLYREAFGHTVDSRALARDTKRAFVTNLQVLIGCGRIDTRLGDRRKLAEGRFDLQKLAEALRPERDQLFKYLGVQTLYDRYLLHEEGRRLETPQAFWMRVAMGLCINEPEPTATAVAAYELFSSLRSCPATPTLFNSGTTHPQLSSCYLSTMEDSIDGIYGTLHQQARLSKFAGGLGVDITPLRGMNSEIRSTGGKTRGVIPWAKQFNDLALAVDQAGKRKGALCLYLETWHVDIVDFLDLKKNTGDERLRCHDINTANWVPDEFMRRVKAGEDWYLFSPDECPDLHDAYGEGFARLYRGYVKKADAGGVKNFRVIKAKDLWRRMLTALKETGHPWMTFKDPANERYANKNSGVIHSSNLCCEILQHTKPTRYREQEVGEWGETAVCTLASPNVAAHAGEDGVIDWDSLAETVTLHVRLLDNALDLCYYPSREAQNSAARNRFLGLGLMGWADLLHKKKLAYDSTEATELAGELQEFISYWALHSSCRLARERGAYPNFGGSLWSKGVVPVDTVEGGGPRGKMDWGSLRLEAAGGVRNGLLCAIAPTATIGDIVGCSRSTDPHYSALYAGSTLSGEFTMSNEFFVREMKARGLWSPEAVEALQRADGDVRALDVPEDLKERFKTAFDVNQRSLIDQGAARQVWLDQSASLNIYYAGDSMKEMSELYFHAWESGLKTTYYMHTRAASSVEKTAVGAGAARSPACKIGEECQACQ